MTNVKIVIGGNFGDEGKGLMTAYFAREMIACSGTCLVILSNGGPQRGHTVCEGGIRHVFRHLGSGTFSGADTYFPEQFIVNPMIFMKEYRELAAEAPVSRIRIYIHPGCRVTTPYEMLLNLITEEKRGEKRYGSVGVGIWETVIGGGKKYGELTGMSEAEQMRYLTSDRRGHLMERLQEEHMTEISPEWEAVIRDPGLAERYLEDLRSMQGLVTCADDGILKNYPELIFENGQGLLLSEDMYYKGYGGHTTPSHTGIKNPAEILAKVYGKDAEEVKIEAVYVTRTYMTRHGAGRFDTECPKEEIAPDLTDLTNLPNPSQGTLRYGRMHLRSLLRRAERDFQTLRETFGDGSADWAVAMTHLNEYAYPSGSRRIKYKSSSECGASCVIVE